MAAFLFVLFLGSIRPISELLVGRNYDRETRMKINNMHINVIHVGFVINSTINRVLFIRRNIAFLCLRSTITQILTSYVFVQHT